MSVRSYLLKILPTAAVIVAVLTLPLKYAGLTGVYPLICEASSADYSPVLCLTSRPVIFLAVAAGLLLFLCMLYHWAVSTRSFLGRMAWFFLVFAFPPEGALAYYLVIFRREQD